MIEFGLASLLSLIDLGDAEPLGFGRDGFVDPELDLGVGCLAIVRVELDEDWGLGSERWLRVEPNLAETPPEGRVGDEAGRQGGAHCVVCGEPHVAEWYRVAGVGSWVGSGRSGYRAMRLRREIEPVRGGSVEEWDMKRSMKAWLSAVCGAGVLVFSASAQDATTPKDPSGVPAPSQATKAEPEATRVLGLTIGDPAPGVWVEAWLRGEPIEGLEQGLPKGKVVLIDFWASWCDLCVTTLPALADLQRAHAEDVVAIAISTSDTNGGSLDSSKAKLEEFKAKLGAGEGLRFAWDREGKTAAAWLFASAVAKLPVTFVVDREGRLAHVGSLANPVFAGVVRDVLAGTWDLNADRAAFETRMTPIALRRDIRLAVGKKEWERVLSLYDRIASTDKNPERNFGIVRYLALAGLGRSDDAKAFGAALVESPKLSKDGQFLNSLAWDIADPEGLIESRDLDLALRAAKQAVTLTSGRAPVFLDTLARVHFLRGEATLAVETLEKAIAGAEKSPGFDKESLDVMRATLARYRAGGDAKAEEPAPAEAPAKSGDR